MSEQVQKNRNGNARKAQASDDKDGFCYDQQGNGWGLSQQLWQLSKENAELREQVVNLALQIQATRRKLRHLTRVNYRVASKDCAAICSSPGLDVELRRARTTKTRIN